MDLNQAVRAEEADLNRMNRTGIVPKSEAKGVDICSAGEKHCIIRSDLGCYMQSTDFHKGKDLEVYSLHPSCQGGDHYLADKDRKFYIIKGNTCRCVTDLSKDSDAEVFELFLDFQGKDHYLWAKGKFYAIDLKNDSCYITSDLKADDRHVRKFNEPQFDHLKNALYLWGTNSHFCFVKKTDLWGIQFQIGPKLVDKEKTLSFHPDVLNFLPGGLAETRGPAFRKWELIKTFDNDAEIPMNWKKKIIHEVGYTKSKTSSIVRNWKVNITAKMIPDLIKAIFNVELSTTAEYGGKYEKTCSENWTDATNEEETVSMTIRPKTKLYVWQYQLGFGKECVLFCHDVRFTFDPNPPSDVPLPPADN